MKQNWIEKVITELLTEHFEKTKTAGLCLAQLKQSKLFFFFFFFFTERKYHISSGLLKYKSQKELWKSEVLKHLYYS